MFMSNWCCFLLLLSQQQLFFALNTYRDEKLLLGHRVYAETKSWNVLEDFVDNRNADHFNLYLLLLLNQFRTSKARQIRFS